MKNFNDVLSKLAQESLPDACDEVVCHLAKEIQMTSNEFYNIILKMESFHMTKVLLICIDKYICGSGLENVFIENSVFGTCVTQAIIQEVTMSDQPEHFFTMSDVIQRLEMKAYLTDGIADIDIVQQDVDVNRFLD